MDPEAEAARLAEDDMNTIRLKAMADTDVFVAREYTESYLNYDDDPERRVLEQVLLLKRSEGPDILRGQSDAVVAMYICGPNFKFSTMKPRHELAADGSVVKAKEIDEAEYEAMCEPSGNGHWIYRPTRTMAEKASDAAISVRMAREKAAHEARYKRQLRSRAMREGRAENRRDERMEFNMTAPEPDEVYMNAPALQYTVARISKMVKSGKILAANINAQTIREEVDAFYALPKAMGVDEALHAASNVAEGREVELGKRKRSPMPQDSASASCAPKKSARFASAVAVDDDGLIWPMTEEDTTDGSLREPSQIAKAINDMSDDLLRYLIEFIHNV